MVKHRVGCVKTTTYNLPTAANHVYGAPSNSNNEGAGAIISNWVTSNPSLGKESSKLIVYSNILAIRNGCVTARAMRKYAAEHPNIRRKEALPANSARVDTRYEGPFGRKTEYSAEPFSDMIQGKYHNFTSEDSDYPNVSTVTKKGSFPKPKPTIASASQSIIRERKANEQTKKHFCMKRFQKVKGTFHLPTQEVPAIPAKPLHAEVLMHHHHHLDHDHANMAPHYAHDGEAHRRWD
jgi:hypothetical protein